MPLKPSAHVRASATNEGIVLLDIASGSIFSANAIGARIWSGLEEGLSIAAIVDRIALETGAERSIVARDADSFVDALKARALVS